MKCPGCQSDLKGHVNGTKTFAELTRTQQIAAIARASRSVKEMREVYRRTHNLA